MPGHRSRLLGVAIAVCAILLPSASAGARDDGGISLPERWRHSPADGSFHRDLALLAAGAGNPAEHAVRAMVHAGKTLAGLDAMEHEGCTFEYREAVSGGDLTGDGLDDVLEYSFVEDWCEWTIRSSVTALEGSTGAELWNRVFGEFGVLFPAGDVNGVPGDDLIEFTIDIQEAPAVYDWTLTYRGVSGASGSAFWTRTYRDPWTEAYVGPTAAFVELDFAIPYALGDLTGDGRTDLLVGRYNSAFADDSATGLGLGRSAALFEVLSGTNGLPAAAFPATGDGAFPTATLMPDADGDKAADVATISVAAREDGDYEVDATAFPGKGGAPLWSTGTVFPRPPFAQGVELDGDGKGDVLLSAYDWLGFGGDGETAMAAIFTAGLGTTRMWFFGTNAIAFPEPVPNVIGRGTHDLLLLQLRDDWSMGASLFDGEVPLTRAWSRSGEYIELAGDATGDGAEDLLIYDYSFDPATKQYTETTDVVSGSNGKTVWTHAVDPSAESSYLLATGADGNANGTADLALLTWRNRGDEYSLLEGSSGTALWSPRRVGGYLWVLDVGHLEGTGDDLIESFETDSGEFRTASRTGDSGVRLWKR